MPISPDWLAGFFDGEGCVGITVAGKHRRCIVRLTLVNTNHDLLRRVQSEYGGHLTFRHGKPTWKPAGCLTWTNSAAALFLSVVGPHIRLKTRQVNLALEFLKLRRDPERFAISSISGVSSRDRSFVRRIRPEMLERELALKMAMHHLNRKGIPAHAE